VVVYFSAIQVAHLRLRNSGLANSDPTTKVVQLRSHKFRSHNQSPTTKVPQPKSHKLRPRNSRTVSKPTYYEPFQRRFSHQQKPRTQSCDSCYRCQPRYWIASHGAASKHGAQCCGDRPNPRFARASGVPVSWAAVHQTDRSFQTQRHRAASQRTFGCWDIDCRAGE